MEYGQTPQEYTKQFDIVADALATAIPDLKFLGLGMAKRWFSVGGVVKITCALKVEFYQSARAAHFGGPGEQVYISFCMVFRKVPKHQNPIRRGLASASSGALLS